MKDSKDKGITLVALVVTIIVLLILAGVSLNFVIGNNGLIGISDEAVTEYEKSRFIEEANISYQEIMLNKTIQGAFSSNITLEEVATRLIDNYGWKDKLTISYDNDSEEIKIDKTEVRLVLNQTDTLKVETEKQECLAFVEIRKKYYPVYMSNSKIYLGEPQDKIEKVKREFSIENSNPTIVEMKFDESTNELSIKALEEGNSTITVKKGSNVVSINVNVRLLYGEEVTLSDVIVNGVELKNWRYLYNDGDKIYLIYADYLESNVIPSGEKIQKNGRFVCAEMVSELSVGRQYLYDYLSDKNIWKNISEAVTNALNNNEKLKKENIQISGVETIGGPDLEILKNSHNTNYPKSQFQIKWSEAGTTIPNVGKSYGGYLFEGRIMEKGDSSGVWLAETEDKKLFSPNRTATTEGIKGYYIPALNAFAADAICTVQCVNNRIMRDGYHYLDRYGLRPMVSIPKSPQLMEILELEN